MAIAGGRRECVYVIGAGFSAGLGYPLISDMLVRLWERLDDPLRRQLSKIINFHHPGFNADRFSSYPNVELLLSEMLVNEQLFEASRQYEGKFTSAELAEVQRDLLLAIAEWFHWISKGVNPGEPELPWLREFKDRVLEEKAALISFNWDLVVDELIFGEEVSQAAYGLSRRVRGGPVLLKPHGSLNWFEEDPGRHIKDKKRLTVFDDETGSTVYGFREFRAPISKRGRIYTPLIVPPVYLKDFEKPIFKTLWRTCTTVLSKAKRVVFLGYSMPDADLHAQFIMRCGFNNQVKGEVGKKRRGKPTGPAEVVIVNPDRGAAERIAAVAGPKHDCSWVSTPVADWVLRSQ